MRRLQLACPNLLIWTKNVWLTAEILQFHFSNLIWSFSRLQFAENYGPVFQSKCLLGKKHILPQYKLFSSTSSLLLGENCPRLCTILVPSNLETLDCIYEMTFQFSFSLLTTILVWFLIQDYKCELVTCFKPHLHHPTIIENQIKNVVKHQVVMIPTCLLLLKCHCGIFFVCN